MTAFVWSSYGSRRAGVIKRLHPFEIGTGQMESPHLRAEHIFQEFVPLCRNTFGEGGQNGYGSHPPPPQWVWSFRTTMVDGAYGCVFGFMHEKDRLVFKMAFS